jgi:hypothetical protein
MLQEQNLIKYLVSILSLRSVVFSGANPVKKRYCMPGVVFTNLLVLVII